MHSYTHTRARALELLKGDIKLLGQQCSPQEIQTSKTPLLDQKYPYEGLERVAHVTPKTIELSL